MINRYEIKLWFSENHQAITTILAENEDEALIAAKRKYSYRKIIHSVFIKPKVTVTSK